tara:strand:+ start:7820 stop:9703 length:1884 start_codon:yes stop_codon:yes gene_type:complete
MVLSKINKKVNYEELETIDDNDLNHSAAKYEINIFDTDIIIAIGKPNIKFVDYSIIFFNLYLVIDNKILNKIGLYEIESNDVDKFLDNDGDLNIDLLDMPILNGNINEEYLKHKTVKDDASKLEDDTEPVLVKNVTKKEIYDEVKAETWIEEYLQSNNYTIKDNAGGGDCLFFVIIDSLSEIDPTMDVKQLRKILADNVDSQTYTGYKELYDSYNTSLRSDTDKLKELQNENKDLIQQMKITKDREYQTELVKRGKDIKEEFTRIQKEKAVTNEMLKELKFMKGIKNIDSFKQKLQTCDFWADTWAVSTLERVLNIKLILFSHESFIAKDLDNVLQCGQLNDTVLESKGIFKPKYFILADYNGWHYKLIKYDNKNVLSFEEIPNKIKELVVLKCMEGSGGVYNLIPKFVEYKKLIQVDEKENMDQDMQDMQNMQTSSDNLYDSNTVFQFYSKSGDKPLPGKGSGETIQKEDIKSYSKLASIPSWRRKLSNFWESEFELDGHKWLSVEHYYQGSKFKNENNEYYLEFSLDSNSVLSKDVPMAKAAGGKTGKLSGKKIRPPDIKIDSDFFTSGRNITEMNKAQQAKFTQTPELKEMLIETKNARLMHYSRGSPPIEFTYLMKLRNELAI